MGSTNCPGGWLPCSSPIARMVRRLGGVGPYILILEDTTSRCDHVRSDKIQYNADKQYCSRITNSVYITIRMKWCKEHTLSRCGRVQ